MGPTDLLEELKVLRKGRGVHKLRIHELVGPRLRTLCEISQTDGYATPRALLTERLTAYAALLPADLRLAATAAFGLDQQVQHPFLQQRVEWLAERIDRDDRTARRRMNEAIAQLAEVMTAGTAPRPRPATRNRHGVYIEMFSAALSLDRRRRRPSSADASSPRWTVSTASTSR